MIKHLFFTLLTLIVFLITACETMEPCEEENYGSVTINNQLQKNYEFDVTFKPIDEGTHLTNEEINITENYSATWDKINSGLAEVWVKNSPTGNWTIARTLEVTNCKDTEITFNRQCELENAGNITIINETGFTLDFDVMYDNYTNLEVTISNGDSYTWEHIPIGSANVWVNNDGWYIHDSINISLCNHTQYTFETLVEPCILNQTGSVTILNNSGEYQEYGISKDSLTADYKSIYFGNRETWDQIERGAIYIFYKNHIKWKYLTTLNVNTCEQTFFDHHIDSTLDCAINLTAEVIIKNNSGQTLTIDVLNNSIFLEKRVLLHGEKSIYTVSSNKRVTTYAWIGENKTSFSIGHYKGRPACSDIEFIWTKDKISDLLDNSKPITNKENVILLEKLPAPVGLRKMPVKVSR